MRENTVKSGMPRRNAFEYYPTDMDEDMIPICDALNALPGVRTFFCCSGHNRRRGDFYISMGVKNATSLKTIVTGFDTYGIRRLPTGFKHYVLDIDGWFWPLKSGEVHLRVSNRWIDRLNKRERRVEFNRIIKRIERENAK